MRGYIKDNELHVVTQEYEKLVGLDGETEIPEKEMVFDEVWTGVIRTTFYDELIREAYEKVTIGRSKMKNEEVKNEEIKGDREVLKIDEEGLKNAFNMVKEATEKILDVFTVLSESIPLEPKKIDSSWAEEVKIRELPSGLKIADRDYYEIDENGDKETEFSWDKAMERFKDDPNWRLPTPKELNQMVVELGYTDEGVFDGGLFAKNLGEDSLEAYKGNVYHGAYWSSIPTSYCYSYYLGFGSTGVNPQDDYNQTRGLTVRCVARKD